MTLRENLYQLKSPILIPGTGTDIAAEDDKKSVRAAAQGGGNYSGRNAMDELGQEIELMAANQHPLAMIVKTDGLGYLLTLGLDYI